MVTKTIGDFGEDAAADFLENEDYEIVKRNFRVKFGEIDIIADDEGTTVFVEVKTRGDNHHGEPSEYVTARKQKRIKTAAACYTDIMNSDIRFDVIEVFYTVIGDAMLVKKINHIKNAF